VDAAIDGGAPQCGALPLAGLLGTAGGVAGSLRGERSGRMNAWARMREWSLRHLARPRPAQDFVPQIDGLRCVAICSVILYHMQGYVVDAIGQPHPGTFLHHLLAEGAFGVPLFFSLSGY